MGRWAPRDLPGTTRTTELHADVDELEEEPPAEYFQRQAAAAERQLRQDNVTDPGIRARLERDLARWRSLLAAASIEEHWDAGEGDRPLF